MTGAGPVHAAEVMELTGWPFLAVLCACSIALISVTMMLWNRWPARWACMDAVRGRRNETYLAVDVPTRISARYRVLAAPRSWAAMGYSTGGFCAVNIAFHHPARYAAAASLSGYFTPVTDASTGDLYRGRPGVQQWNDPQWQAARHHTDVPLYVVAGRADPEAQRAIEHLKAVARGHPPITTGESPAGGHNFSVWSKACPATFEWLAAHLPPATPLLTPPHPGR